MTPFLECLQSWRGPDYVRDMLEQRSYRAHKRYLAWLLAGYGPAGDDIPTYWNELAREIVSSGGGRGAGGLRGKRIDEPGYYRSPYLDRLQAAFLEAHPDKAGRWAGPIHESLYLELELRGLELQQLGRRRTRAIEEAKREEAEKVAEAECGRLYRKEFPGLVAEVARSLGFRPFRRKRGEPGALRSGHFRLNPSGLRFELRADLGGLALYSVEARRMQVRSVVSGVPYLREHYETDRALGRERVHDTDRLPLELAVRHSADSDPASELFVSFPFLLPDVEVYQRFSTLESGVVGLHALLTAFDAFARSFD